MSPLDQALLVLIVGLYLAECYARVCRDAEPLCEWQLGRWGRPLTLGVSDHWKWVLFNPAPWSFSAVSGVDCILAADNNRSSYHNFVGGFVEDRCSIDPNDESHSGDSDKRLFPVPEPIYPSHQTALARIQNLPLAPHQNPEVIRMVERALRRHTRMLRLSATLLALCLIVLIASWLGQLLLSRQVLTLILAATPASWVSTIVLYGMAYRKLFPNRRRELVREMLKLFVSPFAAIRSADHLSRKLFAVFDPVALPIGLLDRELALQFARNQWGKRLSPKPRPSSETPINISSPDLNQIYLALLLRLLAIHEITATELTAQPQPDPDAAGYCPACLQQFVWADRECPNGCGVLVVSFTSNNQRN